MTIIEFLKSQVSFDTPLGDLAKDVMSDKDFPYEKSESGIISYIEFQLRRHGNGSVFEEMVSAFHEQKDNTVDPLNLDVHFTPLRAESWPFLKLHFPSDRAIIVGKLEDIYRVYAVDSASQRALKFDIYTMRQLNDLSIINLNKIHMGVLTSEVSVQDALDSLAKNKYNDLRKPTEPNYSEMLDYLKNQVK
ncbi:YozE family protein [Arcicella lustrica]|uniref:YozE family protein n=1 Tax=Arcicella lustrica TaxID=2984196 RepID=A0ABU5SDN6_9BACT|nr:YozE family protein [Arcicella sp. DC25W]MEA5425405.1 YozE family protein [Arcicella sp. DC25W]